MAFPAAFFPRAWEGTLGLVWHKAWPSAGAPAWARDGLEEDKMPVVVDQVSRGWAGRMGTKEHSLLTPTKPN